MTLQVGTTEDDTQFLRSKSGGFDFHITEQKVTWNATLHSARVGKQLNS